MATGVTEFIQQGNVRERIDQVYPNPGTRACMQQYPRDYRESRVGGRAIVEPAWTSRDPEAVKQGQETMR